ncbi:cyclic lactone autoinducer peptide [Clostridium boliviensis]|uniref:Cyclic lactone autoinducer peptide n=1 Tax=Clostridium boliviensis TaxID=318465 RepID=A0ABU4GNV5_9CLOT|nr:cyclic lactone autoinducer peptide [Clostridium boliviensis]MDW2799307.1 cyclic lactone autoinducer peptide [Clostridium boliviensis]
MERKGNIAAKFMEQVARKSVEMASQSRCMYIYHQPKMPAEFKKFKK